MLDFDRLDTFSIPAASTTVSRKSSYLRGCFFARGSSEAVFALGFKIRVSDREGPHFGVALGGSLKPARTHHEQRVVQALRGSIACPVPLQPRPRHIVLLTQGVVIRGVLYVDLVIVCQFVTDFQVLCRNQRETIIQQCVFHILYGLR